MVEMTVTYEGELHCAATHGPSGNVIATDAPVDNQGRGEAFSPSDLVGAALGSCVLTILGIVGRREGLAVEGAVAKVEKEMSTDAPRRIARLPVQVRIPVTVDEPLRRKIEAAIRSCPVHKSLHPDIDAPITFEWGAA